MNDSHSKGISYTAGFFMLIAFAITGLMLSAVVSMGIWNNMTGQSFKLFESGMKNPANANAYQVIQSVTAILSYLVPAIFTAWLLNRRPLTLLGFRGRIAATQGGLTVLIILIAMFVGVGLAYFNHVIPLPDDLKARFDRMEADYNQQVEAIVRLKSVGDFLLALVIMAFIPALCEETLFRGGLQNFLTRSTRNYWFSVIIVSLIFSVAHGSFYGFLSRFFLGLTLGLIYQYSGRLWLSILAHFVNNAVALSFMYFATPADKTITETTRDVNSTWWGIVLLPLLIGLFAFFKRTSVTKEKPTV